tara:strand:- start:606 stop:1091 length:486 start_codon:yes stop_codon:yes gene_type:complete
MSVDKKWVIFDLDGTLANIETRRKVAKKPDGKMDWDIFFADKLIEHDEPNMPVIMMAQALKASGYNIAILSGRSKSSKQVTTEWLKKHGVEYNILKMRPTSHPWKFMPDEELKLGWFNDLFADNENRDEHEVVCVFDDRQKVVDMWREIGLTCMQVAPGDF